MIHRVIGENVLCGLDIGSQRIKVSLIRARRANVFELLGVIDHPVRGFRNATVSDTGDLSESMRAAIESLVQ